MKLRKFQRKLSAVKHVAIGLASGEPVWVSKMTAYSIVLAALNDRKLSLKNRFSGRIFVHTLNLESGNEAMLIGVSEDFEDAEEVKP